jgi:mono/diheme cytochrome c family protein
MRGFIIAAGATLLVQAAIAQEISLKPGEGSNLVEANCQACHSLSYIPMNSFLNGQAWEAVVAKMIKAFGAPIDEADAKSIASYLKKHYGS